ncbi:MAG: hypothetical protein DMG55_21305 [Acidobacteria bacterium]|nr:MAG: hypothetical protein DMG55_21305 [Acidobacteriota bacterium]
MWFAFSSLLYHDLRGRASGEIFMPGTNTYFAQSDGVLWVEVKRASIRVPVHGLGNLCKTFQAKKAGASAAAEAPREQPF